MPETRRDEIPSAVVTREVREVPTPRTPVILPFRWRRTLLMIKTAFTMAP